MSMVEAIEQVVNANPFASLKEVSEGIVDYIVKELPYIFRSIKTPITPSLIEIKKREYKLQRMPHRAKHKFEETASEQEQFARELASLRQKLDGGASPNVLGTSFYIDENTSSIASFGMLAVGPLMLQRTNGITPSDLLPIFSDEVLSETGSFSPYVSAVKEKGEKILLTYEVAKEFEERIFSDPLFAEFSRLVETSVRKFMYASNLSCEFSAFIRDDIELPSWKRTILRIKPKEVEFEKSMDLWDEIDAEVRKTIKEAELTVALKDSERMSEFNKNFFIEMDLT